MDMQMSMASNMVASMASSAMGNMAMGTQTSVMDMMPTATAAMDMKDMGMDMGSGSCKVNVSSRLIAHRKVCVADLMGVQMLLNWNTVDACKCGLQLVVG